MDIPVEFVGVQFQNLWDHKDNKRKADTKIEFFLQGERLRQIVHQQCRLFSTMVAKYPFIKFHVGPHNIILHPRNDPKKQALSTLFILRDANIEREIKDWPKEWFSQHKEGPATQQASQGGPQENPPQDHTDTGTQEHQDDSQEEEEEY